MKKFAALLFFVATLFVGTNAYAIVDLEGRYWLTTMDDEVKSGSAGTTLNLVDDLGVDDKENFFDVRATVELGSHKLRYGYMPMSWSGAKTISAPINFNGQSFPAAAVNTELDIAYHRLGYEYDIIDLLNQRLGVIFEIKYFDIDARLTSPGLDKTANIKAPVPTIGIAAQAGLPFLLSVGGEITGVSLGSTAWLVDAEAGVNFKPAPFVVVSGGYRILKLHVDFDNDLADISVNGPFVMLKADF